MNKKVNIEVPIDAIKGECSCPIEWFEEWFEELSEKLFANGYTVGLKIINCDYVIKEISNIKELRDYLK